MLLVHAHPASCICGFTYTAARKAQNPSGPLDPDVIAKRTKRHLDELEVRHTAPPASGSAS